MYGRGIMAKKDFTLKTLCNERVGDGVYKMVLKAGEDIGEIKGGQFIHIARPDKTHILRRPFCIADFSKEDRTVTVYYAIIGDGTKVLSRVKEGESLKTLLPLGNGFTVKEEYRKVMLIGGGMGTAVLPAIPTAWADKEYYTFLGFAKKEKMIAINELTDRSKEIYVATDDGSYGRKGFVTEAIAENIERIDPDVIMVCGPEILYKVLKKTLEGYNDRTYISLEKRMGCGIGACLVCNCKIKSADGMKYLRACVDGPVFNMDEVMLDE